jgi:limonene-1,2-epoxide hydrolase
MRTAATLIAVLALAGCGGHRTGSPEDVARSWSAALDRSDDTAAGKLFATDAEIVQDGTLVLHDPSDAVAWNAALPCGGTITKVVRRGSNEVLVVFRLKERPGHRCDAPGGLAAAIFRVEHGKIVLWHQTPPPGGAPAVPDGQTI